MRFWTAITAIIAFPLIAAESELYQIPMYSHGSHTFYINSEISGTGEAPMLVDTGSGYSVINEETLARLDAKGEAEYISKVRGKMADGSEKIFPLYSIKTLTLGKDCRIFNVKAAVLPNNSRQIIGISTLIQAAPFSMSFQPPLLTLSQCHRHQNVENIGVKDNRGDTS